MNHPTTSRGERSAAKHRTHFLVFTAVFLMAARNAFPASIELGDKFTEGIHGKPISGQPVGAGDAVWRRAVDSPVYAESEDGGFATPGTSDPKSYAFTGVPSHFDQITLSGRMNPADSDWVALGFGAGDAPFFDTGGVWLLLRPNGKFSVIFREDIAWVAEGSIAPGFKENALNSVRISYDKATRTLRASINETEVLDKTVPEDAEINFSAAGFGFNDGKRGSTAFTDFQLEATGDLGADEAAPRPASPNARLISPNAFLSTNMLLREPKGKQPTLGIASAAARKEAYFARFELPVPSDGDWSCWVVTLPRKAEWTSPYHGLIDNHGPASAAEPQSGEPNSGPRWENLGKWKLDAGKHILDLVLTDRRTRPDDSYCFSLWKILLVNDDSFVPEKLNLDLDYNPQIFHGQQTESAGSKYPNIPTVEIPNPSVALKASLNNTEHIHAPVWRDYAQGATFTSEAFLIPRLIGALRPRFIRKDHCLGNNAMTRNADGAVVYDFSQGLAQIEAILSLGAEPIVGLDAFPSALIRGKNVKALKSDATFLNEWKALVTAFARYILVEKKLPVRYFQHFNEPEYSGFPDARGTVIATYKAAARALKSVDPKALIGGPGSGEGSDSPLSGVFIDALAKEPELLDFFDFHIYQSTSAFLRRSIKSARERLARSGLEKVPVAITEWGVSSGLTPELSAATTVAYNSSAIKAMVDEAVDIGALFCLVDPWAAEYPGQHSNQYGLVTQDGHMKPSYWGQWLWSRLPDDGERLIVSGEADGIEAFAVKKDNTVWILVWNAREPGSRLGKAKIQLGDIKQPTAEITHYLVDSFHSVSFIPPGDAVGLQPIRESRQKVAGGKLACDVFLESGGLTLVEITLH